MWFERKLNLLNSRPSFGKLQKMPGNFSPASLDNGSGAFNTSALSQQDDGHQTDRNTTGR